MYLESDSMEASHSSPAAFLDAAWLTASDFACWVDVVKQCMTL